jgi:hypothetical protein
MPIIVILDTRILGFHSDRFISLHQNLYKNQARCATNRYFQVMGGIHDIESYFSIDNALSLNAQIFSSHFGHLAIIFMWVSGSLFHIACSSNYQLWLKNPISRVAISHGISDPHLALPALDFAYSGGTGLGVLISYSGIYNLLYTLGFTNLFELYNLVIACELLAVISLLLGRLHLIYSSQFTQWLAQNKPLLKKGNEAVHQSFRYKSVSNIYLAL